MDLEELVMSLLEDVAEFEQLLEDHAAYIRKNQ